MSEADANAFVDGLERDSAENRFFGASNFYAYLARRAEQCEPSAPDRGRNRAGLRCWSNGDSTGHPRRVRAIWTGMAIRR